MSVPTRVSYPNCEHFGEQIRGSKLGHKLTREWYGHPNRKPRDRLTREQLGEDRWAASTWVYRDEERTQHSDAYLLVHRNDAMVNFDLSMEYFAALDADEFEEALGHVLAKGRTFKPVQSLKDWDGAAGAYIMVFDEYRQFYIGQSEDIRKRIKQHWGANKHFDRLIYGTKYDSIFPADAMRALDTTRIFAARSTNPFAVEERAEKAADQRFCLNRMGGGAPNPIMLMLSALGAHRRPNGITAVPMSWEEYDRAWDEIVDVVAQAGASDGSNLVAELARLDMTVYSVAHKEGTTRFMWSRRDGIAGAAARGELSVEDFAAFLEAMGEKIIWPED